MARIKGANLVDVVKTLRKLGPPGRAAVPAHLAHYLDERILASSWYPELDTLELMRVFVNLTLPGKPEAWEYVGRLTAHLQIRETYRHILESREPARIVKHANVIWQSHHDTGEITVETDSETVVYLTLRGYQALCSEWCAIMAGYAAGMLEAAGARNARCRLASCDFRAKMARWKLFWEPPSPF